MNKRLTVALVIVSLLVAGCANMNKEEVGTAVGALAGAVLGKQIGGDRGAAIGLVLGGAIGNRIGAHMDEEDKKKLASLEQRALETGNSGSFVTAKTKATVSVVASAPTMVPSRRFVLSNTLTPYPLVVTAQESVWAFVDTPIYSSLDEKSRPKMVIQQGVPIRIVANVINENWAVVGENNLGIGYVPIRYLDATIVSKLKDEAATTKLAAVKNPPAKTVTAKAKAPGVIEIAGAKNLPAGKPGATAPAPIPTTALAAVAPAPMNKAQLDKEMATLADAAAKPSAPTVPGSVAQATMQSPVLVVQASTECKVVTRKVDAGSSNSFSENVKYCKEPPKGWLTQTA